MVVIQVEEKRYKDMFDAACKDLELNKCLNENNHYNTDAEYKASLRGMHRRFVYIVRTLQTNIKQA